MLYEIASKVIANHLKVVPRAQRTRLSEHTKGLCGWFRVAGTCRERESHSRWRLELEEDDMEAFLLTRPRADRIASESPMCQFHGKKFKGDFYLFNKIIKSLK